MSKPNCLGFVRFGFVQFGLVWLGFVQLGFVWLGFFLVCLDCLVVSYLAGQAYLLYTIECTSIILTIGSLSNVHLLMFCGIIKPNLFKI
jgi:hypothetical protein